MKRAVGYSYTFTPSANLLDLSAIPSFDATRLYAVLDIDARSILYAAGTNGLGYTANSSGVLTLQAPMTGCLPLDKLMIIYDDGDQAAAAEYVKIVQGTQVLSNTNRIPVELDAMTIGLALDATVAAIGTQIGVIGSGPPTLPGSSSGVMGLLRYIATQALIVGGSAAEGATLAGNPQRIGGSDGSHIKTLWTDSLGVLLTGMGKSSALNLTSATTVKNSACRLARVTVVVAGSAAGTINDVAAVGSSSSANLVFSIPNTAGVYNLDWPMANGIGVTPGTGQTVAVSYS